MPSSRLTAAVLALFACAGSALAMPPGATKDLPPPPKDATPYVATDAKADPALTEAVASTTRPEADRARDKFRHPEATLMFWGLRPGMTVVDLQPGSGYWTQIIAPYLQANHGHYIAGGTEKSRAGFVAKFADKARYGDVSYMVFDAASPPFAAANSVDLIITSREIHNWIAGGYLPRAMSQAFAALKPGGILAVEEHRADPRPEAKGASNGYVATQTVMDAAAKAGFKLDGASEVNANPKDTKDYPFGVWTLPPVRQSTADGKTTNPAFDHTKYDAIGESDRMTLRFRKPV